MPSASTLLQLAYTAQAKVDVKALTAKLQNRELEAQPGRTLVETFENEVNTVLNKARDDAGTSAQQSLANTNNVVRMVTAGSKGSFINISQVGLCCGTVCASDWHAVVSSVFCSLCGCDWGVEDKLKQSRSPCWPSRHAPHI